MRVDEAAGVLGEAEGDEPEQVLGVVVPGRADRRREPLDHPERPKTRIPAAFGSLSHGLEAVALVEPDRPAVLRLHLERHRRRVGTPRQGGLQEPPARSPALLIGVHVKAMKHRIDAGVLADQRGGDHLAVPFRKQEGAGRLVGLAGERVGGVPAVRDLGDLGGAHGRIVGRMPSLDEHAPYVR